MGGRKKTECLVITLLGTGCPTEILSNFETEVLQGVIDEIQEQQGKNVDENENNNLFMFNEIPSSGGILENKGNNF